MDCIARRVFHPAGGAGTVFIPMYCSLVGPIQDGSESAATEKFIIDNGRHRSDVPFLGLLPPPISIFKDKGLTLNMLQIHKTTFLQQVLEYL